MRRALVAPVLAILCLVIGSPVRSEATPEGARLTLGVISDIHVQAWDVISQAKFRNALADLQRTAPRLDAVTIVGDLTNGQPADYKMLRSIIAERPRPPIFFTIGNHEYYKAWYDAAGRYSPGSFPNGETEAEAQQRFLALTGEPRIYYDKWLSGYHLIFLGGERYRQSEPEIGDRAYLSGRQLRWLEEALADRRQPGRPIFVFLHQPIPDVVQGAELDRILRRYPEAVLFSGHTHWQLSTPGSFRKDGYARINTSSVVRPLGQGDRPLPPNRSEGLLVSVFDDRVEIAGRDFANHAWVPNAKFTIPVQDQR